MPKFTIIRTQPAVEHLRCEVEAETPEAALAQVNEDGDWSFEFNDSGAIQHTTEFAVYDEDGNLAHEHSEPA